MCKSHFMSKICLGCFITSATKCGPQSDGIPWEMPNLEIISLNKTSVTSLALLVQQGKASGHLVEVSIKTKIYLYPPFLGSSVKLIFQ